MPLVRFSFGIALLVAAALLPALLDQPAGRPATPAQTPAPGPALAARVAAVSDGLRFIPLIPTSLPSEASEDPSVTVRSGVGSPNLLEIAWPAMTFDQPVLRIVQGPAGCCLDAARPNPRRSVTVRPGVLAELILLRREEGGPILWWTEGGVYVAVSGPDLDEADLVSIGRSMQPLR